MNRCPHCGLDPRLTYVSTSPNAAMPPPVIVVNVAPNTGSDGYLPTRFGVFVVHAARAIIVVLALAGFAFADAPAPAPSPKPKRPRVAASPAPIAEPFDLASTEPPEEVQPPPLIIPIAPPPPTSVEKANARGFHVDTQFGALATVTGETGTDVQPTFWINTDGPLALGSRSIGRLGARLGLTSSPGTTFNALDVKTYNAVEADLFGGYVIGAFKAVETMVVVEGGFASRVKGSTDPRPLNRLVRSAGLGLRFDARKSNASMTIKGGFDEATTSCSGNAICTGVHSGFALMFRGQVPIAKGALFTGDCSLSLGGSVDWLTRRDILRVALVLDPAEALKAIRGTAK